MICITVSSSSWHEFEERAEKAKGESREEMDVK
jgi:hypothetical protein